MKHFTKRQIKDGEVAKKLYKTFGYLFTKNFRWAVQSHQIKKCLVTVQNIDDANNIWGVYLDGLERKTTQSKPNIVARDQMKVPIEILKLHRELFLTTDFIFVYKIPSFLTVIRKICFTAVNHCANQKFQEIFHAFKDVYMYYLQQGFRITTLHVAGEFSPLKTMIESMPAVQMFNLTIKNKHVPEI